MNLKIGVLSFQGDVIEHINALEKASINLKIPIIIVSVRTKNDLRGLKGLIIPGGESTTLSTLCQRESMFEDIKKIDYIFGTCAGAIMMSKIVLHKTIDQKFLYLMDVEIDRNGYGRQAQSFQKNINTSLGKIMAVFIRAPRIKSIGKNIKVLAKNDGEIIACEQKKGRKYFLACCFHPELTTNVFHEYFINQILESA